MDPTPSCRPPVPAGYLELRENGRLAERVVRARDVLRECVLCPWECRVNRTAGELGACRVGSEALVSSYGPHFGEESVLVGRYGSGTIFMAGCNLGCVFCQNHQISQEGSGHVVSAESLAEMMLELQSLGCHNINFVSPTHQVPQILEALAIAVEDGLVVSLVYNTGGYDSVETLRILDGIVDIYMPDAKYGDNEPGKLYSGVPDYWDRCSKALVEMQRQVGELDIRRAACDDGGTATIAVRGLLVRHLVLPGGIAHTPEVMRFLAEQISVDTYVNVMPQYRPEHLARRCPELARPLEAHEFASAMQNARDAGLHRFAD